MQRFIPPLGQKQEDPVTADENEAGRLRYYGRRKSRPLKPRQQRLMEDLLPPLEINEDDAPLLRDPTRLFAPPPDAMALEIGFGGGEHLAHLAGERPGWGFIGCEPFINGIAKLLVAVEENNLANIRIWPDDARYLLPLAGDGAFDEIYILYPDPWPKKRHHRRRFINAENIAHFHRLLKPGGMVYFASDIPHYVSWTLKHFRAHGGFEWLAESADDWRKPWPGWPSTRYEAKALREGRSPAYLRFARKG